MDAYVPFSSPKMMATIPSTNIPNSHDAELVYNYHRMQMPLPSPDKADAIFALCSLDLRVARRAAQLFLAGYGRHLIFSGGSGILTADRPAFRDDAEAVVFARVAVDMGVPRDKIIVEDKSTNTGENVRFTFALLQERGLLGTVAPGSLDEGSRPVIQSFILVQKPYMERRTYATFMKQWPGFHGDALHSGFQFAVTSPILDFEQYPDDDNPRDLIINIMVGDLIRIREYPALGFQIPQDIPPDVWEAGQRLIAAGFDKHLP